MATTRTQKPRKETRTQKPRVEYSLEIAITLCTQYAEGHAWTAICQGPGMPSIRSVMTWLNEHAEFRSLEAAAYRSGTLVFEGELAQLLAQAPRLIKNKDGETVVDGAWVQWQRTKIDAVRWRLAHRDPWRYSDKIQVATQSEPAALPAPVDPLDSARRVAFLLADAMNNAGSGSNAEEPASLPDPVACSLSPLLDSARHLAVIDMASEIPERRLVNLPNHRITDYRRRASDPDRPPMPDALGRRRASDTETLDELHAQKYPAGQQDSVVVVLGGRRPLTGGKQ